MTDLPGAAEGLTPIDNRDLAPITVVAQCLDNQWVRQDVLARMLDRRQSYADVDRRRRSDARAEYLRAILNAEQVVVNRAYFVNNPVVHQDFTVDGPAREAFRALLGEGVLVPYLVRERTPRAELPFGVDPTGWAGWLRVLDEVDSVRCLRLSWDDTENDRLTERCLFAEFRRFLLQLTAFDVDELRRDLGLDEESRPVLRQRLRDATVWAVGAERATRDTFYREFLVEPDTNPADGRFRAQPLVAELKQLVDLRYNTTLPDAVDGYAMIPADSLRRTAMQEYRREQPPERDMDDLLALLRTLRPQVFDLVQLPLRIDLTGLELHHVRQARRTDEWQAYVTSLRDLLDEPRDFAVRGQQVYDRYVALAGRLAVIVGERRADLMAAWEPAIRVSVEVLGSTMSVVFDGDPRAELVGEVATEVAARGATAVVRFAVVGRDRRRAGRELGTGIDVMRVHLERAGEDWRELVRRVREAGFPLTEGDGDRDEEPNIDRPQEEV
ncbi:hypothetical protein [Micromonospora endolithica]|uniref:Uncharacterized protein n=1 Tax=Micromonospora endolithica TaxID=230091 RepID=A0A3A9ZSC3_9ACTN|nr:hypothetical protein [Micromonospora endolithica]RKN51033.1 hypothetical protein D7223_04710 [Micromonospora endolithica]TWJ20170.1 hypothetical protein JD76_00265 [Micromonospora endolithica]